MSEQEEPTRVLLVRHAVNDWVGKRLAGWTPGVHLNERGQLQAAALGERLASQQIAAVYSSPLERAQETAAAIAAHHNLPIRTVDNIGETRCGDWTGQTLEDLSKTDLWRQVQVAPSMFRFPNGESLAEAQARMVAALETMRTANQGQTFVVVSHSDPLKALVAFYLGMPLDLFQRIAISPASITEFVFSPYGAFLVRCNDSAHVPAEPEKTEEAIVGQGEPGAASDANNGNQGAATLAGTP